MKGTRPLAWRALAAAGSVVVALGLTANGAAAANDWGQRIAGRHVHDLAQVLTPAQVTNLESSAAALDRAGAPTVVYLRLRAADDARHGSAALVAGSSAYTGGDGGASSGSSSGGGSF